MRPETRQRLYSLRGEIITVTSEIEFVIAKLAIDLADSSAKTAGRQWKDVKRCLPADRRPDHRHDLQVVASYFSLRNAAAHGYFRVVELGGVVVAVEGEPAGEPSAPTEQIFRLTRQAGQTLNVETVTFQDLENDAAACRAALGAVQAVARTLDETHPGRLRLNSVTRPFILGFDQR